MFGKIIGSKNGVVILYLLLILFFQSIVLNSGNPEERGGKMPFKNLNIDLLYPFNLENVTVASSVEEPQVNTLDYETKKSAVILFKKDFAIVGNINRDISGYNKIKLDFTSSAGQFAVEIEDAFKNTWRYDSQASNGINNITILFEDFRQIDLKRQRSGFKRPYSIERFRFEFLTRDSIIQKEFKLNSFRITGSKGLAGPSMGVDPLFDFYKENSWCQTARLLGQDGVTNTVIIFTRDMPYCKHKEMIDAVHREGMACTLRLNPPTDFEAFDEHQEWRQKMLDGSSKHDWRVYLCPNNDDFRTYYIKKISDIVKNTDYDCLLISELWFEVWGGAYKNNPTRGKYACLCDKCCAKFKAQTGINPAELFDENSSLYFEKPENKKAYKLWCDFRADTINGFCRDLVAEVRKVRPEIKINYMYLSDCTVETDSVREYQAQDFEGIIKSIMPDIVVIQDAWQDWLKEDLSPEFTKYYVSAYLQRARQIKPDIVFQVHADIGSIKKMTRSIEWMNKFSSYTQYYGGDSPMYYEFTLNLQKK